MKDQKSDETSTYLKVEKFMDPIPPKPRVDDSDETVSGLVMEAVNQAAADPAVLPNKSGTPLPPKSLLGLLVYCYAKGTYASAEIAEKLHKKLEARRVADEAIPDAKALRRFRRFHRQLFQSTLEKSLRLIRRAMIRRTMSQTLPGSEPTSVSKMAASQPSLAAPGEETTLLVRREAERKLENAAIIDSTLDD
jgi:transposase-like protein DUF772